jgi:hypothetical protein
MKHLILTLELMSCHFCGVGHTVNIQRKNRPTNKLIVKGAPPALRIAARSLAPRMPIRGRPTLRRDQSEEEGERAFLERFPGALECFSNCRFSTVVAGRRAVEQHYSKLFVASKHNLAMCFLRSHTIFFEAFCKISFIRPTTRKILCVFNKLKNLSSLLIRLGTPCAYVAASATISAPTHRTN